MMRLEKIVENCGRFAIIGSIIQGCGSSGGNGGREQYQHDISATAKDMVKIQLPPDCPLGQEKHYEDSDGDGYGANTGWWVCDNLPGYVTNTKDCDDVHKEIYPGATEVCDGADNNCDGTIDEKVMQDCSTICGKGVQECHIGSWGECSAGTFCPTGDYSCAKIIACEKECNTILCKEECVNKGNMISGKRAEAFYQCLDKSNCSEIYSSCVQKNCLEDYSSCFEGKMSCSEVWKCGYEYSYMNSLSKEIGELQKKCDDENSKMIQDCVQSGEDMYQCIMKNVMKKCSYQNLIDEKNMEKEKKKDSPGDFFGICASQADTKAISVLYDAFMCIYQTCGAMPTPKCVLNAAISQCKLAAGVEGCN